MEPIATFSGLASGVQWRDLIDQLMAVERRPAKLLEQQITRTQTRSAAWLSFQSELTGFQDAAKALNDPKTFGAVSTSLTGSGFKASATTDASPGSYAVEVLQLAQAEKIGGAVVESASTALGQAGEFWLNGRRIEVAAGDTLKDLAYTINAANTGTDATGVSASVVGAAGGFQLVLSARQTGSDGIDLAGGGTLLGALGLTDGTTVLKHATSDGAMSDGFAARTLPLSTLRGVSGPTAGTATFGTGASAFTVALDLSGDLDAIAQQINDAVPGGSNVRAAVVTETVDGETVYRLDISGTTAFDDPDGVLQTLGVLEGGRGAVAQALTSGVALQEGAAAATSVSKLINVGGRLGDTLTVTGTRADGTQFSLNVEITDGNPPVKIGYSGVTTVQDLMTLIREAGAFATEPPPAVVDGQLVFTDAEGGASQSGLSIVAHNESGGSLDFGAFGATTVGRDRVIVEGTDAAVRIDGVPSTHRTNSVAEAIPGVSLTLSAVTPEPGAITVSRDTGAIVDAVQKLVDGYNGVAGFVSDQFSGGEGSNKPLSGDSTLRGIRSRMLTTMQQTLTAGVSGDLNRLGDLGIEIQRDGTFSFDTAAFEAALETDPTAVERLFGVHGSTTGSGLRWVAGSDDTVAGTYTVNVTSHATTARATGVDLGATYTGLSGNLTLTDLDSGKAYTVAIASGADPAAIVQDINTALGEATAHAIESIGGLRTDPAGTTPVTGQSTWAEVHDEGGAPAGVAAGDTITISGRRDDGSSFVETLQIEDPATQTVGELRDRIQNVVGTDATVELTADGKFSITSNRTGSSLLELTLSSDNAGGGSLQLGTQVSREGKAAAGLSAALVGGAIELTHQDHGSAAGFRVEYSDPLMAADLGLGADGVEVTGTDIEGTIGGMAATGSGQILTGMDGTDTDGLMLRVEDAFTAGSVTFGRGIASRLELAMEPILGTGEGSIQSIIDGLDRRITSYNDRIDDIDVRLERRREDLIRRFTAMEQAMAVAQNQSAWLASQIGALPGSYSRNEG